MKKRLGLARFLKNFLLLSLKKVESLPMGSGKNFEMEIFESGQCDQIGRFIGLWATF